MNRDDFTKHIRTHFAWLIEQKYEMIHIETSIYFIKKTDKERYCVNFAWGEYNDISIQFVAGLKGFNKIEEIIHKYSGEKLDFTIRKRMEKQIPEKLNYSVNGEKYPDTINISDEKDVILFSDLVQDFYNNELSSFFDSFKDYYELSTWLEKNQNHKDLIVVNRNLQMVRTLVVYKESKSEKFQDLYNGYSEFLRKEAESNKSPYVAMNKVFLGFKDYFEANN